MHLGLRAQILLLGIAGVIVVGAIYLIGLQIEDRSQQIADRFATLERTTAKVSEGLLQAREIATDFLRKPDVKKIAAHDELVKLAVDRLSDIESTASALPEGDPLRQSLSFRAVITSYTTRFSNVASAQKLIGLNENDGLQGKLRSAVHAVESKLKTFDQPQLAVLMLMMRRHEKDFMLRNDEKYGDELDKRAGEFLAELAKSDLPDASKAEIVKLMQSYKASFLAFMAGRSTLTEEAEDLAQIYDRLRPALTAVRKSADQRLETVKAELAGVRSLVFWSICITVLVMLAAALLFGRWLTRWSRWSTPWSTSQRGISIGPSSASIAATRSARCPALYRYSMASCWRTGNSPPIRKRPNERRRSSVDRPCSRWRMISSRRSAELSRACRRRLPKSRSRRAA